MAIKKSDLETPEKKKNIVQKAIDMNTGEIVDGINDEDFGMGPEVGQPVTTMSQANIVAELTGIVLKPSQRIWALKVTSPDMIKELNKIYSGQKAFMLKFKVPKEIKDHEVLSWEEVEFQTMLMDLSLKGGKATCHGYIDHKGACAMSELIQNWKGATQFFLDGIQQSIF